MIPPEVAGGVAGDPPDAPRWPELEHAPPTPGARTATDATDVEVPPDLFAPASPAAAPAPDPFAAAAAPELGSPASALPALTDTNGDPFALPEAAAPAKQEDPFGAATSWDDPFAVPEPGPRAGSEVPAPMLTTSATQLLEPSEPAKPPVDLGLLALEEHETPQPRAARLRHEGTELDLGLGMPDVLGGPGEDLLLSGDPSTSCPVPPDADAPGVREASPSLGEAGPPATARAPAPPPPAAAAAGADPVPAPAPEARRGRLGVAMTNSFSLALLIAVAVALFLTWRSGLVGRVRGALVRGTQAPAVEASAVTGGLYDTAAGSPVLVVRGRIGARGALKGPVRVRVDLVDGARVVASAAGLAGAAATAEQVYGAGTTEEAAALRRALDARAPTRLAAGDDVPFLVVFPAPAPDPRGLALRVEAEPAAAAAAGG